MIHSASGVPPECPKCGRQMQHVGDIYTFICWTCTPNIVQTTKPIDLPLLRGGKMGDIVFELWDVPGAFIILEKETGYFYSNQVGGTACGHPKVEGVLIPLHRYSGDVDELGKVTRDYWPSFPAGVDLDNVRRLVGQFKAHYLGGDFSPELDMVRLARGEDKVGEAWLPVITPYGDGWMTWENSD